MMVMMAMRMMMCSRITAGENAIGGLDGTPEIFITMENLLCFWLGFYCVKDLDAQLKFNFALVSLDELSKVKAKLGTK